MGLTIGSTMGGGSLSPLESSNHESAGLAKQHFALGYPLAAPEARHANRPARLRHDSGLSGRIDAEAGLGGPLALLLHGCGWGSWLCGSFLTVGGNLFDAGDGSGGMDGRAALAMTAACLRHRLRERSAAIQGPESGDMDGRASLAMTALGCGDMDGRAALAMTVLGCGGMDGRAALAMTAARLRHRERSVAIHGARASGCRHPCRHGNARPICAMGVAEGYGDVHGKHFDLIWQGGRLAPGAGASCNTGVKWVQRHGGP